MKKGFTLIEILVVATIIALLAAIAATSFASFNKSGRDARRKADVEQLRAAFEMYRSNNATYPTGLASITCASGSVGLSDGSNTYISKLPVDPSCPTYTYHLNGAPTTSDYTIGAYLEGTNPGGSCGSCGTYNCNYCVGPYGQR